jgi:hypothetical protein
MSAIKAGDLVMLVRGHECLMARAGGIPFIVTKVAQSLPGGFTCAACGQKGAQAGLYADGYESRHIPLQWLKRIDPPAIPETTEREQETV